MRSSRPLTLAQLCWVVAVIALALGIPRLFPEIWALLNRRQIGSVWVPVLISSGFWLGILLATTLGATAAGRLYACGWVTLSVFPLVLLASHLHVATSLDFGLLAIPLAWVAALCFLGGFVASLRPPREPVAPRGEAQPGSPQRGTRA
jgi:hypothetical protein